MNGHSAVMSRSYIASIRSGQVRETLFFIYGFKIECFFFCISPNNYLYIVVNFKYILKISVTVHPSHFVSYFIENKVYNSKTV